MKSFMFVLVFGWGLAASACVVPVFRYALEFWDADRYLLDVRLPASAPDSLRQALAGTEEQKANLAVRKTEEAGDGPGTMRLFFPSGGPSRQPIVELPATVENLRSILHSPVRNAVAESLLEGVSAVFLFLESGDAEYDGPILERFERMLRDMEQTLELPPQPVPEDGVVGGPPLGIRFALVRLARDDPRERVLVQTLLATEPDLRELKGPMVFPVFGRGRALYAIVDRGIRSDVIFDAGAFLIGPCSCQVKAQNPGTDLLMAADWDAPFADVVYTEEELPPLTAITLPAETEDDDVPQNLDEEPEGGMEAAASPAARRGGSRLVIPFVVFGLVVVLGSFGIFLRRRP